MGAFGIDVELAVWVSKEATIWSRIEAQPSLVGQARQVIGAVPLAGVPWSMAPNTKKKPLLTSAISWRRRRPEE